MMVGVCVCDLLIVNIIEIVIVVWKYEKIFNKTL